MRVLPYIIPGSDFLSSTSRPSRADVLSQVSAFSGPNPGQVHADCVQGCTNKGSVGVSSHGSQLVSGRAGAEPRSLALYPVHSVI